MGTLAFNEFANSIERIRPMPWRPDLGRWEPLDYIELTAYLQTQRLKVTKHTARDGVLVAARDKLIHPVRDYLSGLVWDGVPRLDSMAVNYLGAEETPFAAIALPKFMIGAVARIMNRGWKVDTMLVLEGLQGAGKSQFARILAGDGWFSDSMQKFHGNDAMIELQGRWIHEVPELEALTRSTTSMAKAFLSKVDDIFRPPYGSQAETFVRQCVFIGTTNKKRYLRDQTGARRFWPIACGKIDCDRLANDRDALWAEAVARFRAGEDCFLTEEQQEELAVPEQRERMYPWPYRRSMSISEMANL